MKFVVTVVESILVLLSPYPSINELDKVAYDVVQGKRKLGMFIDVDIVADAGATTTDDQHTHTHTSITSDHERGKCKLCPSPVC